MKMLDLKPCAGEPLCLVSFFPENSDPWLTSVFLIMLILPVPLKKRPLRNEIRKNETSILSKNVLQKALRQSFNLRQLVFY